jgi:hypothetical protein
VFVHPARTSCTTRMIIVFSPSVSNLTLFHIFYLLINPQNSERTLFCQLA